MKRVTGIGGVFFKSSDPVKTRAWYSRHLGIPTDQYGGHWKFRDLEDPDKVCVGSWSPFSQSTEYFQPSEKEFMINYRVENLAKLLEVLKEEGVKIVGEIQEESYGKFAWIMDLDGNKIELWEPVDQALLDYHDSTSEA
ncbi:MAG: VOC family protein [Bacteroidota bacterium]